MFRALIDRLLEHLKVLDQQVDEIETQIKVWHRSNEASQRLGQVPGIGPLTATAMVATVGNARNFKNGREFAAWLSLVPRQHSSGGKPTLLGISKRGNVYLRTLLIHGARSLAYSIGKKAPAEHWLCKLINRRGTNMAVVAQANKTARIVWAMLSHAREFRPDCALAKAST
jgi:transposase